MSGIEEGMIVKMLMSINRLCSTIGTMAQVVGDNTLAQRMTDIKPLSERGIVKLQSLYLEVEQEHLQTTFNANEDVKDDLAENDIGRSDFVNSDSGSDSWEDEEE
jgi:hypothetical protein